MSEHWEPHFDEGQCICGCRLCAGYRQPLDIQTSVAICICPDCPCSQEEGRIYITSSEDKETNVNEPCMSCGQNTRQPPPDGCLHKTNHIVGGVRHNTEAHIRAGGVGIAAAGCEACDLNDPIGTVRWFGESWGAPVCDPRAHVETPVGESCAWGSEVKIKPGDQGVGVPSVDGYVWYHLDCWMRVIAGNVAEEVLVQMEEQP